MVTLEAFSLYIMFGALAPLVGAFILLFFFIFEERIDLLEKQKREYALEKELQNAMYIQLNQEIQPHFLFNTLNSILSLARLDRKAELISSIETLSKLLKFKYTTNNTFITIEDELTYVQYYLEIQKTRFRDRLRYEISKDSEIDKAIIIPFLIQTIVENSFKHSFERNMGDSILKIIIRKSGDEVHVTVWNNAFGKGEERPREGGLGLGNIKKRLELLFPDAHTDVKLTHLEDGASVLAIFPFQIGR